MHADGWSDIVGERVEDANRICLLHGLSHLLRRPPFNVTRLRGELRSSADDSCCEH